MIKKTMDLPPTTLEILNKLQNHSESYVVGGCLRDHFFNKEPNDLDFVTTLSVSTLEKLFPNFQTSEAGRKFGVGRLRYKGQQIEITSRTLNNNWLFHYLEHKDFTINSLIHDGKNLIGTQSAFDHINSKKLHYQEHPSIHLQENPQSLIRAIRLSSELPISWSDELHEIYKQSHEHWNQISSHRLNQEGLKLLHSTYLDKAFIYLNSLGFIPNKLVNWTKPDEKLKPYILLCILSTNTSKDAVSQFISLFHLSKWKDSYENLYNTISPIIPAILNNQPIPVDCLQGLSFKYNAVLIQDILSFVRHYHNNSPIFQEFRTNFIEITKKNA
ncbi:hypothetical protein [Bacillus bombysepticus]|uniref:hypothetical protein n=1 Tax=Bacillus bombysepticus TaxID=658666 RepID=UPI003015D9AE